MRKTFTEKWKENGQSKCEKIESNEREKVEAALAQPTHWKSDQILSKSIKASVPYLISCQFIVHVLDHIKTMAFGISVVLCALRFNLKPPLK